MNAIATVEGVEVFVRKACGRFEVQTLSDPLGVGIGQVSGGLEPAGGQSLGGDCWRGEIDAVDLVPCKTSTPLTWIVAIESAAGKEMVVHTDGSTLQRGRGGGGWDVDDNGAGSVDIGSVATGWDGEVAGIR